MEIDLKTLLQGKATIIKGKEYFSTEAYVTPFLERMSKFTNDFRVQAKLPDQISITKKELYLFILNYSNILIDMLFGLFQEN